MKSGRRSILSSVYGVPLVVELVEVVGVVVTVSGDGKVYSQTNMLCLRKKQLPLLPAMTWSNIVQFYYFWQTSSFVLMLYCLQTRLFLNIPAEINEIVTNLQLLVQT